MCRHLREDRHENSNLRDSSTRSKKDDLDYKNINSFLDPDQGQRDGFRERHHVLQGGQRHPRRGQRGRLQRVRQAAGRHHSEERPGYDESWRDFISEGIHCARDEGKICSVTVLHVILYV